MIIEHIEIIIRSIMIILEIKSKLENEVKEIYRNYRKFIWNSK